MAVGLAKAFGVDLLWLLDDSAPWDDHHGPHVLGRVPDELLVVEIRRRYIDAALKFRESLKSLSAISWKEATQLLRAAPWDKIPREATAIHVLQQVFNQWDRILDFSTKREFGDLPSTQSLPDGVTPKELTIESLAALEILIYSQLDGLAEFVQLIGRKFEGQESRFAKETIDRRRRRLEQIASQSAPKIKRRTRTT